MAIKPKREEETVDYWQTISDVLSALLLILMLIIMLLILYVVLVPENDNIDPDEGDRYNEYKNPTDGNRTSGRMMYWEENEEEEENDSWFIVSGGGGGGLGEGEGIFQYEKPGEGEYDGMEKAAVYVKVIDAETRRLILEEGVTFTLYDDDGKQMTLDTHYPERISYTEYCTTEEGVFYLPEKIWMGDYTLREVTEPVGYDATENIGFTIDKSWDWDEPYILEVPLYPSRNTVRIQNVDSKTGEDVGGGAYDIIAAEDIITADGTLRFREGQVAAQVECDENGYAESKEIYLGNYTLHQSTAPRFYARRLENENTQVIKKVDGVSSRLHEMECERTTAVFSLVDELYAGVKLAGAEFAVSSGDGASEVMQTNENGEIVLDQLNKSTTYTVTQLTTAEGYRFPTEESVFTVSIDGRIEQQAVMERTITNRTLRASFGVRDILMRNLVSDYGVVLYDPQGELVKTWNSSGIMETVAGLTEGDYTLVVNGGGSKERIITITDTVEIQRFDCMVWTDASIAAVAALLVLVIGGGFLIVAIVRRRKQSGEEQHDEQE